MEISSCIEEKPATDVGSGSSVVLDAPEAGVEAESRKLPSSRYKGVVPQPNGRWGAQIYEKHQRVWLGTFSDEAEAAGAYDVAAQRFRGREAVTNFRPLSDAGARDAAEAAFLGSHSKAEIVDMLRKHTYRDELLQSRRSYGAGDENLCRPAHGSGGGTLAASGSRELLFDKAVTPSDVGKLNRLVIPKQHAEKHFPLQTDGAAAAAACKGVLLNFEDAGGKVWRFRYSYWNSSQSYVLTKGWSRFVKEKGLKPGDVVSFHRSTCPEPQLFIDWQPRAVGSCADYSAAQPERQLEVFRLFGVNILRPPAAGGGELDGKSRVSVVGWIGKRSRAMELIPPPHFLKRQCERAL